MTREEAEQDLRNKVREFFTDALHDLDADLDKLIASGSGVVDVHMTVDGAWRTPRLVAGAIFQEWVYRTTWGTGYVKQRELDKLRVFL